MYFKCKILFAFFLFFSTLAYSQISNKKCKWVRIEGETFALEDSLTVLPSSIKITIPTDSSLRLVYDVNSGKARISYVQKPDSIFICYAVLPYSLNKVSYHRNPSLLDSNNYYSEDFFAKRNQYAPVDSREELFASPGLNKTGSISRGISFGNNQNVFVNSVLNLQLDGKLTDDITITAAISDQNIPFQPEGNTQQLQEFDKVYVQLKGKSTSLIAGDIVFRNKPSNFLRFYKNVQGVQGDIDLRKDSLKYSSTSAGVAISKGKFSSMLFAKGQPNEPIEGVQGPYRLRGANNEKFITVLANSERVYLDGKLLVRGFDFDYVIDYNQAEITFTNTVLITQYSVIRIDFEYTERNYSRMIIHGSHYQNFAKGDVYVNFYEEKDNPRNPLTITLSDEEKDLLSEIGDTLNKAVVSGATEAEYSPNKIMYEKDGAGIFSYSTDTSKTLYEVIFSDVGVGNGSYSISASTANGRVFVYVGAGMGNYDPVKIISTPRKKQMVTIGGSLTARNNNRVFTEFARSSEDLNLYSPADDSDNGGNSLKVGFVNPGSKKSILKKYKWTAGLDYEYNEASFVAIDRFRDPNFERDWSSDPSIIADNHIINGSFGLIRNAENNISYRLSRRLRGEDVNGVQHYLIVNQKLGRFNFSGNGFMMLNNRRFENSDWRRLSTNLSYRSKYLIPGIVYTTDKNSVTADSTGLIVRSAMYFDEVKFYIRSNDTLETKFFADHSIRKDKLPLNGELTGNTNAHTSNAGLTTRIGELHEIASTVTYRYLENLPRGGIKAANEETVLGRVDWNSNLLNNHIRSELTVVTGTGRELKRQFIYIPVPVSEGTHYWDDLNGDGIQDLNEFFEAVFTADKQFIKSFIPTDEYIKAYTNSFSYRLDVSAPRNWRTIKGIKSIISRFSNISSWTLTKKITDPDLLARFLPVMDNVADTSILSAQKSLRSALFFNRSNPTYGMDLNYASTENKQFLTQGFENRILEEVKLNARFNVGQSANFRFQGLRGARTNESDFLVSRNYDIKIWKFGPEASYQPKNNLRFTILGSYMEKQNVYPGSNLERLTFYEGGMEVKVNKVSQRTINGTMKYIRIISRFNGTPINSVIGNEMLEALQPGNNFTWNITWQERLANGLQLSFTYEGRKSDLSDIVHIGRMQVSALF